MAELNRTAIKREKVTRLAKEAANAGIPAQTFYETIKGTDLSMRKQNVLNIYRDFGGGTKLNYDTASSAKTTIDTEYSIRVKRGFLVDQNGDYVTNEQGHKIGDWVTVRTNKKLSRKEVIDMVKDMPTDYPLRGKLGIGWLGAIKIGKIIQRR